jgi:hypothetical protein
MTTPRRRGIHFSSKTTHVAARHGELIDADLGDTLCQRIINRTETKLFLNATYGKQRLDGTNPQG